jgi:alkaline phosphatase
MAEQGDIDWANHTNDYRRMIGTIWDLDNAVRTAIEFVDKPGDNIDWTNTLLIVTADHGNSLMRFVKPLGRGELPMQIDAATSPCYADYCGKFLYPDNEVKYGSGGHTNELVRLYALGNGIHLFEKFEGTWYPGTQIIDNTQIFQVMVQATGLYRPDYYQIQNDAR